MRFFIGGLFVVHGLAHLVGFATAFHVSSHVRQRAAVLTGGLHLREAATRALGIVWLLLGVAFVGLGTLLFMNVAWWPFAAASLALLSLVMCCLNLPDARTGAALNGVLLAALGLMAAFMNGLFSFRD